MNGIPAPVTDRPVWRLDVLGHVINSVGFPTSKIVNVFYYYPTVPAAPNGPIGAVDVKNAFLAYVAAAWNAVLPTPGYVSDFIIARDITSPLNPPFPFAVPLAPAVVSDYDTTNAAAFFYKKTSLRGRNFRGGWHLGPVPSNLIVGQKLTGGGGGGQALFNALASLFRTSLNVSALGFVYSPRLFSASLSDLTVTPSILELNPLDSVTVRNNIGSMRRRQGRAEY